MAVSDELMFSLFHCSHWHHLPKFHHRTEVEVVESVMVLLDLLLSLLVVDLHLCQLRSATALHCHSHCYAGPDTVFLSQLGLDLSLVEVMSSVPFGGHEAVKWE